MNIEEIMKPYFDKKNEFEKKYIQDKNFIKLRLERLRDNKEQEIESYVEEAVSENPNFYVGYGAMIRKDLEQAYAQKEADLERQLRNFDKFYRLDVRELSELKGTLRKSLIERKKDLELQLEETRLNFDNIMLKLSRFERVYDDQHRVLNGAEYRKLFDESNHLIEVKYSLERQLNKVNEYLSLTELTQEEIKVCMMSMTPWEKEEYDRRKSLNAALPQEDQVEDESFEFGSDEDQVEDEPFEFGSDEDQVEDEPFEFGSDEDQVEDEPFEFGSDEDQVEDEPFEFGSDEDQVEDEPFELDDEVSEQPTIEEVYSNFIATVYDDILQSAKKQRSVKINNGVLTTNSHYSDSGFIETAINLPSGVYLNKKDLYDALDNYVKKNKGRTFVVEGIDKSFVVDRKTVRDIKKSLRDYSTIKLLKDKKLGFYDVKRVYGKEKAEQYNKEVVGELTSKIPTGEYINLDEFGESLQKLFVEKSPNWLEKLTQKLNKFSKENSAITDDDVYDLDEFDYSKHRTR